MNDQNFRSIANGTLIEHKFGGAYPFACVNTPMTYQIRAVRKYFQTIGTLMPFVANMHRAHVHIQIRKLVEIFITVFALMIFDAGVRSLVAHQCRHRFECIVALLTDVFTVARMNAMMRLQVTGRCELFAAYFTLIGLQSN